MFDPPAFRLRTVESPTPESVRAAQAAQQRERFAAGACPTCGRMVCFKPAAELPPADPLSVSTATDPRR